MPAACPMERSREREVSSPLADNTAGIATWLDARESSPGGDLTRKSSRLARRRRAARERVKDRTRRGSTHQIEQADVPSWIPQHHAAAVGLRTKADDGGPPRHILRQAIPMRSEDTTYFQ